MELEAGKPVSLQELMVSTLAITDALAKLLIEKGIITDAEFKQKLLEEHAVYQGILNPLRNEHRLTVLFYLICTGYASSLARSDLMFCCSCE